ncbi:MAG TPA: tetratricopeptide repeat protein, partial [Xanthomonadales bacterium]|nr:tetratricopeptide repeat protein [Xanthomonadales bacterium]
MIASAGNTLFADEPRYVGSTVCAECHKAEFEAWKGSHHDLAMQHASDETVLGDFSGVEITVHGVTSRFFRRDGKFLVNTEGPGGSMADFEIAYTFGVAPLQQYLVPFPDGRMQALRLSWDSRPESEGGQRWFHLYPDQRIDHDDELHWTGRQQNWNYMCADCHSTNLVKDFEISSNSFDTTWSEINVACEACHGPGHNHSKWAAQGEELRTADVSMGLSILLNDRSGVSWNMNPETGIAKRNQPLAQPVEVEVCADCHSRRGTLKGGAQADGDFLDHHMPAFLTEGLYYPDGQILDEVYVWGSFTQSRMYQAGVTCSDCHEPHSQELRAEPNTVCAQCHLPTVFAVTSHHGHPEKPDAPGCVDCHMSQETYMVVDPRRDHSMRNPYPPLSASTGVPNACNQCHAGTSVEWAVSAFNEMFPQASPPSQDWVVAFHQARNGLPQAELSLVRIAADVEKPDIARATAVIELDDYLSPISGQMLEEALKDESALVRIGSLRTLEALRPEHRFEFAKHLLDDKLLAVRLEAGRVLAETSPDLMTAAEGVKLRAALDDYVAAQRYNGDRPESWLNLGNLNLRMGDVEQAEKDYRQALKLAPDFGAGYLNLADHFRYMGREGESAELLRAGLEKQPEDAALHHALGLSLVRREDMASGLAELRRSVDLA